MSYSEIQALLGRLYTDPAFRALFFRDPEKATSGYALRPQEDAALRDLDERQIEDFASGLVVKRRGALKRSYPLTFGLRSERIEQYFQRYCAMNRVGGRHISRADALQFGPFLEASLADLGDAPPFAAELARFEWICIQVKPAADFMDMSPTTDVPNDETFPGLAPGVKLEHFQYDVTVIAQQLAQDNTVQPRGTDLPTWVVWCPADAVRPGLLTRINSPLATLIGMCDRRTRLGDIVAAYAEAVGDPDVAPAIAAAATELFKKKTLCAWPPTKGRTP
jgi:hypothetical protein